MPFVAKSAAPCMARAPLRQTGFDQAVQGGITLFTAPAGYLSAASLAARLAEAGRSTIWLRLDQGDADPATFLVSLVAAAQRLNPSIGNATLEQMQRRPGPVSGWPPLFASLARELHEALPNSAAVVFEYSHSIATTNPTLRLAAAHILPNLARGACILTSDRCLPRAAFPEKTVHRTIHDLRSTDQEAQAMAERASARLPVKHIRRAVALVDGRWVALVSMFAASAVLGDDLLIWAIDRAVSADDLLSQIARAWLAVADDRAMQSLALALRLEYSHPALASAAQGDVPPPHGPWLQALADEWMHIQPIWQVPLRALLRGRAMPERKALGRAADYLVAQGAVEPAIPILFDLGDFETAAQAIAAAAERMMNLGQWEILEQWLEHLPASTLRKWPWLLYIGGELAWIQGRSADATRSFATATRSFETRRDIQGMCQSLLAESGLSAQNGDYSAAHTRALAASRAAETAGLTLHQGWATWQLGWLSTQIGDLERASVYFGQARTAAEHLGDWAVGELVDSVETLVAQQRELHQQSAAHRQAYIAAEHATHQITEQLNLLLAGPAENRDALLHTHGWAHLPLLVKLALPAPGKDELARGMGFWRLLLRHFDQRRRPEPAATSAWPVAPTLNELDILEIATAAPDAMRLPAAVLSVAQGTPPCVEGSSHSRAERAVGSTSLASTSATAAPGPAVRAEESARGRALTVYMLGPFRVMLNDRPIQSWPSGRGRAALKYLLAHRDWPRPRDVLMDLFWPDADPEAARNNLNVAIHGLRQALRAVDDSAVVEFHEGAYRLAPSLDVWVDAEEFDRHSQAGRRLEAAGQGAAAVAEYEQAIGLYQGDYMEDDPYEEWAVLTRERLRIAYLDTLDHLSQIHFGLAQYGTCATLCQLLLARDSCREDVHRRLMRCYSRQSQRYLALRQYQSCADALRAELEIEPEPATIELHEQIRRREQV